MQHCIMKRKLVTISLILRQGICFSLSPGGGQLTSHSELWAGLIMFIPDVPAPDLAHSFKVNWGSNEVNQRLALACTRAG